MKQCLFSLKLAQDELHKLYYYILLNCKMFLYVLNKIITLNIILLLVLLFVTHISNTIIIIKKRNYIMLLNTRRKRITYLSYIEQNNLCLFMMEYVTKKSMATLSWAKLSWAKTH